MGHAIHHFAGLLSAIALAGCSWNPFQRVSEAPTPPPRVSAFFNPVTGTLYRLPATDTLAERDLPRIILAATRDTASIDAARRIDTATQPQAAVMPINMHAPVAAAPPKVTLRLDHEFASITRMVPFAISSATLGPLGTKAVAELVPIAHEARELAIRGRTDATGNSHANEVLAGARANSVASAFVAAGVPRDKISTSQCIDCFVATNTTKQGRRLNRRVDVEMHLPKTRIAQLPPPVYALETPPLILARSLSSDSRNRINRR